MSDLVDTAQDAVADAADHPLVERAARFGYGANAVMHAIIGVLAIRLASGSQASADQNGVLQALVQHTFGKTVVLSGIVAWAALALWQVGEACLTYYAAKTRLKSVAKAVTYAALSVMCVLTLWHGRSASSTKSNVSLSARLLQHSWGIALMAALGAVIIGVGGYHIIKGVKQRFRADLQETPPVWAHWAGVVGYIVKGLALVATGAFVANAAFTNDASDAGGMDAALHKLLEKPFGGVAVLGIGLGFAVFAVYSVARARYARV